MRYTYIIYLLLAAAQAAPAQAVLTLDEVFRRVRQNHPLARQADLLPGTAAADLLKAKGGFDPKLFGDYSSKIFSDKTYYALGEYGAKLPTWFGLELKAGFNTATGSFLNPESNLPSAGQAVAGFGWTLGRGLLMDERRADLLQARAGLRLANFEKRLILNDLHLAAAKSYWAWAVAETQLEIYGQALQRAQERLDGIRESWRQGDKPAIDTLEAFLLVQTRQFDLTEAQLAARNARIELNFFLWESPLEPASQSAIWAAPAVFAFAGANAKLDVEKLEQEMLAQHPAILATQVKLEQLTIERRLKKENRKPQLDLNYNLLGSGWRFFPDADSGGPTDFLGNNTKFGVQLSYPILNRKARGDLQKTDLKIEQTSVGLAQKTTEQLNKLRLYASELETLARQSRLFGDMVSNYRTLLEAEQEKFRLGESSVFLLNSREQKLLEAQVKWAKVLGEYQKTAASLQWAVGKLGE